MTEAEIALAREAVTCKHWEWMSGMWTLCRVRLTDGGKDWLIGERAGATCDGGGTVDTADASGFLPDLSDPATVGCLEALVQRVLGHDNDKIIVHVQWGVGAGYRVMRCRRLSRVSYQGDEVGGCHDTKIAALVAALKAAP